MNHANKTLYHAIILSLFCVTCASAQPEWVAMNSQQPKNVSPQLHSTEKRIEIGLRLPGFYKMWMAQQQKYHIWMPGAAAASPDKLPVLSYVITLPEETIECHVHYISQMVFAHLPVSANLPGNGKNDSTPSGQTTTTRKHNFPEFPITVKNIGKMHGQTVFLVNWQPFCVQSEDDHLYVADNAEIRIFLPETAHGASQQAGGWLQLVNCCGAAPQAEEDPPEYLIVTPQCFVQSLQPLIDWRTADGMLVNVKTVEQIRNEMQVNAITADTLHGYLTLYYRRQPNLTYILLVGDVEHLPVKYQLDEATDFYYTLLDGSGDLWPDVYLGRLPVDTIEEVSAIVDKTIAYEKNSPSRSILLASCFQDDDMDGNEDQDYIYTSEMFRDYLMSKQYKGLQAYVKSTGSQPQHYSNGTTVPPNIQFTANNHDIIDAINSGVSLVNHRAHGDPHGWNHPPFSTNDLVNLQNNRYPLMFLVDCATARFDAETALAEKETEGTAVDNSQESFGEQILRMSRRGAVALIAPTRDTGGPLNQTFNRGLMGAVWPAMFDIGESPASRLGQILYRARIQLVREFCPDGVIDERVLTNFRCYHILGDPALRIRLPQ